MKINLYFEIKIRKHPIFNETRVNDFSPPVDLLDSLHRCRQSRFLCNNEDRTKKERQISKSKITTMSTIASQESRKEHGSLQELPCSPVKEREEVIMMMILIVMMMMMLMMIILSISINLMMTMANALIPK